MSRGSVNVECRYWGVRIFHPHRSITIVFKAGHTTVRASPVAFNTIEAFNGLGKCTSKGGTDCSGIKLEGNVQGTIVFWEGVVEVEFVRSWEVRGGCVRVYVVIVGVPHLWMRRSDEGERNGQVQKDELR
jgi:hypothetical protein